MCGICGIVYCDPERHASARQLERMAGALWHRGPDDGGVWTEGNAGLGFRRLSIIDLSPAGHQPMGNEDGSVWIVFNGEIYNFQELRSELIAKGHSFRSRTDSETIVHLWEEAGEACVERLRGMFAFAIWDSRRRALFLARDREGKKPLFYAELPDRLLFGSEVKALLEDPDFRPEADLEALHHYLAFQSVPAPWSAFKGVRKLPPAHTLLYLDGRVTLRRYWKLSYREKRVVKDERDAQRLGDEVIERLREAVRIRLMSDVPLGAFLSGGIDSSLVVAMMAGLGSQPVKTFSIGFTNEEYDELPYARSVAQRYGTDHHEFIVTPDAEAILPDLVWHYNEPFADSSAIPTYYVAKLAREHVTVALTGDGGDENFAGYPRYQFGASEVGSGASVLLRLLRQWMTMPGLVDARDPKATWGRLRALTPKRLLYYLRITHFHEGYQGRLYTDSFRERVGPALTVDWMLRWLRASDAADGLDSLLDLDLALYLPDTLMTKVDVASMAHSLETRCPLLDQEFLEFAATIPANLKLKDGVGKHILKQAAAPYLPAEVIHRKKMGFGVPIDHWFRNELRGLVRDTLLSSRALERGYFRKAYVEEILRRHDNPGESWHYLIWNLLMLEMWHLMFIDRTLAMPKRRLEVKASA
jgi:asparagine synthase (glutamine-hydrolysing)